MSRSVKDLSRALRAGQTTSRTLAEEFLDRRASIDSKLGSFVIVDDERLLAEADAADALMARGTDLGPLHGIPVGIKDIINVAGYPTRCGSPLYPSTPVDADAEVVANLRRAGALIAGKTTTHELACGVVSTPASNPYDLDRVPGGSSGGSGAAIAAGLVPIALGSDTGGSIRIPAALCGVVGHKPTYGLVSVRGVEPLSTSLDHLGPLGATVADCAFALTALTGGASDYSSTIGRGVDSMRIGVLSDPPFAPMQPDVEDAFQRSIETLHDLGAQCVPLKIESLQHTLAAEFGIIPLEAYEYHAESLRTRPGMIDPGIRTLLIAGATIPESIYRRASKARVMITHSIVDAMNANRLDALVSPTLPATASTKANQDLTYDDVVEHISVSFVRTTAPFNLSGQPTVSVPCGVDRDGLPIGIQFTTRAGQDGLALQIAAAFEASAQGAIPRPTIYT
jgi:aspartyl-tRNA(Asn)/glutamyl-tRNA(Gln) amidotransferase subunit A